MKQLSIVIVFVLLAGSFVGQDLSYRQYSTKDGIPSDQVYHMFQDDLGYIWFATDRGIAKYDGTNFVQYDQLNGLPSSTVFKFYPQENGEVWCSTFENEWFFFDPQESNFSLYKYNDSVTKYSEGGLNEDLVIDEKGTIHIGYQNLPGVLSVSADGKVLNKPVKVPDNVRGTIMLVSELHNALQLQYFLYRDSASRSAKRVLENSETKIVLFDPQEGYYSKALNCDGHNIFSIESKLIIQGPGGKTKTIQLGHQIIGMGKFAKNRFWVGFRKGGLKVFDLYGNQVHHFLDGESVTHAFHDEHQGFWVSTLSNGVFYAKNKSTRKHVLDGHIAYIHNGSGNEVLVGTYGGSIYECHSGAMKLLKGSGLGIPALAVYNKTVEGYVFLLSGKLIIPNGEVDCANWVGSVSENERKPILFGGYKSLSWWDPGRKELKSYELNNRTRAIDWAPNGVWVGALDGLFFCDTLSGEVEKILLPKLLESRIECIRSANSSTFFGTMGSGLVMKNSDTILQISKNEGLASNLVHELHLENDSTIWVATNNGLNLVLLKNGAVQIRTYNMKDGLQDNYISDVYVKDEKVWIGTKSGLFYMEKPNFEASRLPIDLRLSIKSVQNDGQPLYGNNLAELQYDQNDILVNFNIVYFGGIDGVEYRYKLLGVDGAWTKTLRRTISYKSLAPGSYRLAIQARSSGVDWGYNEEHLDFTIFPPFYKSGWFIFLLAVTIIFVIYLIFRIRVLTYNRDIVRELMRVLLNRLTPKSKQFKVRVQGATVKVNSLDVGFVKSTGNYLEIHTTKNRLVTRMKIGDFENIPPDKLDYIRVNRSYIVRIDKITSKSPKSLRVLDQDIPIGRTYQKSISELLF